MAPTSTNNSSLYWSIGEISSPTPVIISGMSSSDKSTHVWPDWGCSTTCTHSHPSVYVSTQSCAQQHLIMRTAAFDHASISTQAYVQQIMHTFSSWFGSWPSPCDEVSLRLQCRLVTMLAPASSVCETQGKKMLSRGVLLPYSVGGRRGRKYFLMS